jgi:hypothetical protein
MVYEFQSLGVWLDEPSSTGRTRLLRVATLRITIRSVPTPSLSGWNCAGRKAHRHPADMLYSRLSESLSGRSMKYSAKRFKSLAIALKEIEPRVPQFST